MKFIGKLFLTLALLLLLGIVLIYFLLQTRWAAGYISRWINDGNSYSFSLGKIDHSWSNPGQIVLSDVKLTHVNQPEILNASKVDLDLSWRQLTEPYYFERIVLVDGSLNLTPSDLSLPLQANALQLNKMAIISDIGNWHIKGQQINAGITPWQPQKGHIFGDDLQFQLSAKTLVTNNVPAENVLIQGAFNKNQLTLSNFGADLARGQLTGKASRAQDGSWTLDDFQLSNVRWQTAQPLSAFWQELTQLPKVNVKRFDLINARLQGQDWAFSDMNVLVKNATFNQGEWQSEQGEITLNAAEMISGRLNIIEPIVNLGLSPQGIDIKQASARWEGGLLRTNGNWIRDSQRLQLNELTIATLEYTLPENWRQLWLQALPSWLSEVYISKFSTSRNLIIDISPQFPFQLTALSGFGNNLLLAHNHQWGMWSGKLNLNASDATFNKFDVRRASLTLEADRDEVKVTELSALTKEGLLEATATVNQQPQRDFSLKMKGQAVPVNVLNHWGWPELPLQGNANLQLNLQGQMPANLDFKPTLQGTLHALTTEEKQIQQRMVKGEVTIDPAQISNPPAVN